METTNTTVSPATAQANREHEEAAKKHQEEAKAKRTPRNLPGAPQLSSASRAMAATASALQAKAKAILAANKPITKTQAEADAGSVKALRQVATSQMELHSTGVATLAIAWRESALHLIDTGAIAPDKNAANRLLTHIRSIANEPIVSQEKDKTPEGKANVVVLKRQTLFDSVGRDTERVASRAAMLLAVGDKSKVRVGYIVADKLPAPMLLPGTEVQSGKPNRGNYFLAISAPANILRPMLYLGSDDKANKDGTYNAAMSIPNTNSDLRPVLWAQIEALFDHHFDNRKLAFDSTSKTKGMQPTGMLVKPPAARASAAAGTGTGAPTMETALAKLGNTPEAALVALASKVRDFKPPQWGASNPMLLLAASFRLAREAICACNRENFLAEKGFAEGTPGAELALLFDACNECVTEKNDTYRTIVDGKPAQVLNVTAPPVLPEKSAAQEEEKRTA